MTLTTQKRRKWFPFIPRRQNLDDGDDGQTGSQLAKPGDSTQVPQIVGELEHNGDFLTTTDFQNLIGHPV